MNILITGVTGFIGKQLAERLSVNHRVIGMARSSYQGDAPVEMVRGCFDRFEDLRQLDGREIHMVVHLAAVTGGCSEEDGIAVNVQGTRRLYRYLLDRGCRRFITASSIAAVGCLHDDFIPERLPMPDDHPCLAQDAYGLSKALMEEMLRYLHRRTPDAEFVNLRLGGVVPEEWMPADENIGEQTSLPFVRLGRVYVSDVIEAIARISESTPKPRVDNYNLVGPDISTTVPAVEILREVLVERGADLDLSYYVQPGNEYKPIYDISKLQYDYGFQPVKSTRRPMPQS